MTTTSTLPPLLGLGGVKLPVRDLEVTARWYTRILGWIRVTEFPDATGTVVGLAGRLPGRLHNSGLAFRLNPAAQAQEGLELTLVVDARSDLEQWSEHLDREGVGHSPIIDATTCWLLVLHDPDGHEIHLFTREEHGIDQTGRPGYGRRVPGVNLSPNDDWPTTKSAEGLTP